MPPVQQALGASGQYGAAPVSSVRDRDGAEVNMQARAAEARVKELEGALNILLACWHGDEATCGCRNQARAVLAVSMSDQKDPHTELGAT